MWGVTLEDLKCLVLTKTPSETILYHKIGWFRVFRRFSLVGGVAECTFMGAGGLLVLTKQYLWSFNMCLRKSLEKTTHVFGHFLIFDANLLGVFRNALVLGLL